jgi:hypothetical protein
MAELYGSVDVPDYDYRSIRNAVLDLEAVLEEIGAPKRSAAEGLRVSV